MVQQNAKITSGPKILEIVLKELHEKNVQLELAHHQFATLTHAINHNFQEPVRKIQILSDMLLIKEESNLSAKGKQVLERILRTSSNLHMQLKDILRYFNIDNDPVSKNISLSAAAVHTQ